MRTTALALLLFTACHSAEQPRDRSLSAVVVGTWDMEEVYQDGQGVTEQHDPSDNRWFAFESDGTFISDGDPHGRNTGRWTLNEQTQELHIDSDAGENDDSYWIVSVEGNTMHWQGARFEWNKRFELVHLRR